MTFTISDCKILDCGSKQSYVNLWHVRGINSYYYPTKMVAEAAARSHFPNETAVQREGRVSYKVFLEEES